MEKLQCSLTYHSRDKEVIELAHNNLVDFSHHRKLRAERCYDNAIECGSYFLAACIAANHSLGEDKIRYAAEREYESSIRNQHFH